MTRSTIMQRHSRGITQQSLTDQAIWPFGYGSHYLCVCVYAYFKCVNSTANAMNDFNFVVISIFCNRPKVVYVARFEHCIFALNSHQPFVRSITHISVDVCVSSFWFAFVQSHAYSFGNPKIVRNCFNFSKPISK